MVEIGGRAVPRHYGDPAAEYRAAREGAGLALRSHEGRLRVLGRDRLDLLQRLSTNELADLEPGQARATVLTTPVARIVDLLWVLNLGESLLCLVGSDRAAAVRRWLTGYIFFRDEVKLSDASTELGQLGLYGPNAAQVAEALAPGAAALETDRFIERDGLIVARGRPLAGAGFHVIAPEARLEAAWAQAVAHGATPIGEDAYQWLRLAAGLPEAEHELTGDYLPLEADLWHAVSFAKGCYVGQEIIARMESRGKLARRLVGVRLEAAVPVGAEVRAGQTVVGTVTSAATVPGLGPVALSILKTAACEPGTAVSVAGVSGRVAALPFD
jgi:aminomethyltransferase